MRKNDKRKDKFEMKHLLFILTISISLVISSFAMQEKESVKMNFDNYEESWKKVTEFEKNGQPKSAAKEVDLIVYQARKELNSPQLIKALLHQFKYQMILEEDAELKIIKRIEQEINNADDQIAIAVLHSLLAESYWQFYQNNRHKFSNRTHTQTDNPEDYRTWDLKTLLEAITSHYLSSLTYTDQLQNALVADYDPILLQQNESELYRPTIYDVLAHRAINFFTNSESGLSKPIEEFSMNERWFFEDAAVFISKDIPENSKSLQRKALIIFQELLSFRLRDNKIEALVDADLKRYAFVNVKSTANDKSEQYITALQTLAEQYERNSISAYVNFKIANYWYNKSNRVDNELPEDGKMRVNAEKLCESTIQQFGESFGAKNCASLLEKIRQQKLSFKTENVVIPNEPFKGLVNYTNVSNAYFKVVPITKEELVNNQNDREKWIRKIVLRTAALDWNIELPDPRDRYDHSAEIKVDGLPIGNYVIISSWNKDFKKDVSVINHLSVSNITYTSRRNEKGGFELYVLHRKTGQPLNGATVQTYTWKYDYKTRKNIKTMFKKYHTDVNGFITIPHSLDNKHNRLMIEVSWKEDFLSDNQSFYTNEIRESEKRWRQQTTFFTDRSIYRPGQTIYFKGILIETNGEENKILANQSTQVIFRDVNYQEIAQHNLTTNEFGSFQGSFTAPSGGLTGQMQIQGSGGQTFISIEEYKRPTFEVKLDTLEGSYSLDQEVTMTGKALSYSGAAVIDGQVNYRVVREVQYPIWFWGWGYYRMPPTQSSSKEIKFGKVKTGEDGSFSISFTTEPDLSIDKKNSPQFRYTVHADVVDISGETRTNSKTITAGYVGLNLNISYPENWNRDENQTLEISTTNLDGRTESADVSVELFKLIPPNQLKKSRLWNQPDQFTFSKEENEKLFTDELYNNEDDITTWERILVKNHNINTGNSKQLQVSKEDVKESGIYWIEAKSKDNADSEIAFKGRFVATSEKDKQLPAKAFLTINLDRNAYQPGDVAEISIGTSLENAHLVYLLSFDGIITERKRITLNSEIKKFKLKIEEKHRGGLQLLCLLVNENRSYQENIDITIAFEEKDLQVEWMTYRDLMKPGDQEEWQLKIKGSKGDLVASELLASMYDKSLDYFKPHQHYFNVSQNPFIKKSQAFSNRQMFSLLQSWKWSKQGSYYPSYITPSYDQLNLFGFYLGNNHWFGRGALMGLEVRAVGGNIPRAKNQTMAFADASAAPEAAEMDMEASEMNSLEDGIIEKNKVNQTKPEASTDFSPRKNLNETAFFFPQLQTNAEGEIIIKFTMPEALTTWKFMGLAHDKNLHHKIFTKEVKTQKELMVTPHFPRFFREGDAITITSKIDNLSDNSLNGKVTLKLMDALSGKLIETDVKLLNATQSFYVNESGSTVVEWKVHIPKGLQAVTYEVIAQAGDFSDGITNTLPVLTNRMLVTETMPVWLKGEGTKTFTFEHLKDNTSNTLDHYQYTLEYTSNPVWYAVQALPYLMEFPHECTEQLFSRYYANTLAAHIANSNPRIQEIFEQWKSAGSDALLSNLEKNQELKALLIEETPWLRDAQNETERKKRIALLFDLNRMANEQSVLLQKLEKRQTPNGGFTWFPGMRDSRYITQHIMSSIAHLYQLNVSEAKDNEIIQNMVEKAIPYLDARIVEDFESLKKHSKKWKEEDHLSNIQIHYLYVRGHFRNYPINGKTQAAFEYYKEQAEKYWLKRNFYHQGMVAIALNSFNSKEVAAKIMASIKEYSIVSEEMGMYWKQIENGGYYWYNAPIESHALLIEAFHTVSNDQDAVNEMKVWLLKQKQIQDWKTTKATTEAIFALLLRGDDWLQNTEMVEVKVGGKVINPQDMNASYEPGTGYFKVKWNGKSVDKSMATVQVTSKTDAPSWGAAYWQYFEDLDQIKTFEETPLQLKKQIFVEVNTDAGPIIKMVDSNIELHPGDKLKVRIELRVDRNMEFVHMKDLRASGLEPINVLSQFKYQDGLGYYESTKDAATHFFFDYLPKGVYVFEYPLRVAHKGDFSNGITSIQSMYAPEFSSHSEGVRLDIK